MSTLKRIMSKLTSEKKEKMKKDRIKRNKKLTLEWQLGYYIGEFILNRHLPTLSTDMLKTRKVIEVSEEDTIENKRLNDEWFNTTRYGNNSDNKTENGNEKKWEEYFQHNKMLELKYLPHKLECYLSPLNVKDMDEFKKGLIVSLWDSDLCSYSLKPNNIKISNDKDGYFTIFEFILSKLVD
jgi:hypothetical protein